MRLKEIEVYKFHELSEKAKDKFRYSGLTLGYYSSDDAIKSIAKLAEHFNSEFKNYSIDFLEGYHNKYSMDVPSYMEDITEEELKSLIDSLGEYNKDTFKGLGDCVLTGVCFDDDAIDGLRIAYFNGIRDIKTLLERAFDSWYKSAHAEAEYQISNEGLTELCTANDYEFLSNGIII